MALSAKAIRVFAAVEVLRDNQRDVRHALATLFEPDLAKFNGKIFDPGEVSREINEQYKLGMSPDVISGFADIFLDRGWISKINDGNQIAFLVQCSAPLEINKDLQSFKDHASDLAAEFREFIRLISPLSQVNRTDEELIDDLVDWLMRLDRATEDNLRTASRTRYKIGTKIVLDFGGQFEEEGESETTFLCARFIEHLFKSESNHIPFLIELGEVGLITEVVRDFQRPTTAVKRTDLCVYLDAPLALDYLGLSGAEPQASVDLILNGLISLGGSVRVFRQSVDEMQAALGAMLGRPVGERTGPTADAIRRGEVLEAFAREVASKPDGILKPKNIGIVDQTLDAFPNEHKFFSKNSFDLMYSQIGWVREDAARAHDATITTLAMRKRAGIRSDDIFDVKHVVLTRNPTFPHLARRIARDETYIGPNHVGPAIHQRQLATAIWLRAGARSDVEIPRRYILASCRRVLTLRKNIVEKVHQLKSALSKSQAEQLELLLSVDRSAQVLMDKTLGSASIISSSNISVLLEEMKKAQIEENLKETEDIISQIRQESKDKLAEVRRVSKEKETALSADAARLAAEVEERKKDASEGRRRLQGILSNCISATNRKIAKRRRFLIYGVVALFIIMSAASFFGNVENPFISGISFLIAVGLGAGFQFSAFLRSKFLDRLFHRYDHEILKKMLDEFGFNYGEVVENLTYGDGHFALSEERGVNLKRNTAKQ